MVSRFYFVADRQHAYGVKRLCKALGVSRSGFYRWQSAADARAARSAADTALLQQIRAVHAASTGTYGVPRVIAELREGGMRVNHKRVERLMRGHRIVGVHLRRKHRTTVADPTAPKVPDLLERDFTASAPNQKYVGDITYLPVVGGRPLYLATDIDLCSRRLAGFAIAEHMRTALVLQALADAERSRAAWPERSSTPTTDRSTRRTPTPPPARPRARRSMAAIDSSAETATAEACNATFKRETLQGAPAWPSAQHAHLDAFARLTRYNTRRHHSRLGQRSPPAYEMALHKNSTTLTHAT